VQKRLLVSRPGSPVFQTGLIAALIGFGLYFDHEAASAPAAQTLATLRLELARQQAAPEVQQVAAWAVDSLDHAGLPFVVIDRARARLFAFDSQGRLQGSARVLPAISRKDGTAAPATPAGRFVADPALSAHSGGIVWVRADTVLSLRSVACGTARRRPQRLACDNVQDKRSADGSLQVAADFYRDYLSELRWQESVAYVLPEALPWQQVFGLARPPGETLFTFVQGARRNPL
jgi:hypothetical protein